MPEKKTTSTTTRSRSRKPAEPKPKAEPKGDAKAEAPKEAEGRVVANKARPTRLGFTTSVRNTAEANGWTVTDLTNDEVVANGGVHLFKQTTTPDGGVLCVKGELKLVCAAFLVKDGSSNRMDSTYLWVPGATQGKRIGTVYQTLQTLATGEAAAKDASRQRAPKGESEAETKATEPEVDLKAMTKPQLTAFAGERNITIPKHGTKVNIVDAITKALAEAAA